MNENDNAKSPWCFPKTRVSRIEYLAFVCKLNTLGTTCSRFFRKVIRETNNQGPDLFKDDMKTIRELLYQIAALGRNVNQLLKAYHTGQPPGILVDHAALAGFYELVEKLREEVAAIIFRSKQRWVGP